MEPALVKLYALSTYSNCASAKRFLDSCDVPYECVNLDSLSKDEAIALFAELERLSSRCVLPTIVIGNSVVVGYHEKKSRRHWDCERFQQP